MKSYESHHQCMYSIVDEVILELKMYEAMKNQC